MDIDYKSFLISHGKLSEESLDASFHSKAIWQKHFPQETNRHLGKILKVKEFKFFQFNSVS